MNHKVIRIEKNDNYRLIVISDIHAHKDVFNRLLDKVKLCDEDYLVIVGDFINRGKDSYGMYLYMKELSQRRRTIILKGNHESFMQRHVVKNEYTEAFFKFLKADYYETLIGTIIKREGKSSRELESSKEMLSCLEKEAHDVQKFFSGLPLMLYFDDMRFVHGGYDESFSTESDETKYLKFDNYNELAKPNEITTIVGHWPASELREDKLTNLPYFNEEKKIIFVDGGLGVKHTGELNALVIEKRNGKTTTQCVQENDFEKQIVRQMHEFNTENLVYLNYPNNEFEVLQRETQWSKCRHIKSGKEFSIFTELLIETESGYTTKTNYINNYLNLQVGTEVELCKAFGEVVLVKHEDQFGWLMKSQLNASS